MYESLDRRLPRLYGIRLMSYEVWRGSLVFNAADSGAWALHSRRVSKSSDSEACMKLSVVTKCRTYTNVYKTMQGDLTAMGHAAVCSG
jgi:hypothetical protein